MTGSPADDVAGLLDADLEVVGRFADASNATLLVRMVDAGGETLEALAERLGREPTIDDLDEQRLAVYKPQRGEAPLWDFPNGTLHLREVAAYEVSAALGWGLVPLTVLRADGPFGAGSLQRFVPHDPGMHYFRLLEIGSDEVIDQLRRMVVFDLVIDNADRKGGHVLLADQTWQPAPQDPRPRPRPGWTLDELGEEPSPDDAMLAAGRVQLVDHGVSLHVERKLRTVAWEFVGERIAPEIHRDLRSLQAELAGSLGARLQRLLAPEELAMLSSRVDGLLETERLPGPRGPRAFPWPPL